MNEAELLKKTEEAVSKATPKGVYTVESLHEETGIPKSSLSAFFKKGILPAMKVGKHWITTLSSLDKAIEKNTSLGQKLSRKAA